MEHIDTMVSQPTDRRGHTATLSDGRQLGYAEFGAPDGYPVFLFHGTPGSRLWFLKDDPVAYELGLRLIATDRPGYGLSDPKSGRSILDYPHDIAELADSLNIEHFSVLGTSGGSVYSSACAYALPKRVNAAGLIAGVKEFINGKPPEGMCRENRTAFFLARHLPWLARFTLNIGRKMMHSNPEKYIKTVQSQVSHLCPSDQEIMQSEEAGMHVLMHMKEAFLQNVDEGADEPALISRPWGFDSSQIRVPVHIWHGTEDTLAPIEPMKKLVSVIPDCKVHAVEDKGHFLDAEPEIWKEILLSLTPDNHLS